jgi:DnaJ-domain-containing protein 1
MTDNFTLLNEPRRPWLDPDSLKRKFLILFAEVHPDRVHNASVEAKQSANQRYSDLNAAYNCLREPKERLQHLLELERGAKPKEVERISSGSMDVFFEVGQLCRHVDVYLAEKARVTSPLLKVQLFEESQEWTDKLNSLQQKINARRDGLISELQTMNRFWESASNAADRQSSLTRLEEIYRLFGYFNRWSQQIQERIVQLSFE